jgi:hypothetical protein
MVLSRGLEFKNIFFIDCMSHANQHQIAYSRVLEVQRLCLWEMQHAMTVVIIITISENEVLKFDASAL